MRDLKYHKDPYEYFNDFVKMYRNDKNFNQVVRSKVLSTKTRFMDIRYKVTYIKSYENELVINIKVSGLYNIRTKPIDIGDKPKKITGKSHVTFNEKGFKSRPEYCNINNRSLNEDIRNSVIKDVFSYVRLFGVQHEHNIRIGKIKACKSVD